jgi:hypothetical protein
MLKLFLTADLRETATCPRCNAILPRDRHQEVWVEVPVTGGWIAAYRLVVKKRRPVVGEVRLFPEHPPEFRDAGRWSGEPSAIPAEGIPGGALRALRLKDPLELFPKFLKNWERQHGAATANRVLGRHGLSIRSELARKRPGRAGRSDTFYLPWAAAYVERLGAGSRHPVKDLAAHPPAVIEGYVSRRGSASEATVRDLIHQARERGLLTRSPPGRPGGELTPKAERLIRQAAGKRGHRSTLAPSKR